MALMTEREAGIRQTLADFGFLPEMIDMFFSWFFVLVAPEFSGSRISLKVRRDTKKPLWHFTFTKGPADEKQLEIEGDVDCQEGEYWVPPRNWDVSQIKKFSLANIQGISYSKDGDSIVFFGYPAEAKCHVRGGEAVLRKVIQIELHKSGLLSVREDTAVERKEE
jgi:hypothetical protein